MSGKKTRAFPCACSLQQTAIYRRIISGSATRVVGRVERAVSRWSTGSPRSPTRTQTVCDTGTMRRPRRPKGSIIRVSNGLPPRLPARFACATQGPLTSAYPVSSTPSYAPSLIHSNLAPDWRAIVNDVQSASNQ